MCCRNFPIRIGTKIHPYEFQCELSLAVGRLTKANTVNEAETAQCVSGLSFPPNQDWSATGCGLSRRGHTLKGTGGGGQEAGFPFGSAPGVRRKLPPSLPSLPPACSPLQACTHDAVRSKLSTVALAAQRKYCQRSHEEGEEGEEEDEEEEEEELDHSPSFSIQLRVCGGCLAQSKSGTVERFRLL